MTDKAKPDRLAREAAALRANLLKRKDQRRQREQAREKPDLGDDQTNDSTSMEKSSASGPGRAAARTA
jgi:hypothetical protein